MPFNAILQDLTERSGAGGAALLSVDGEMVASFSDTPAIEMDLIGAHQAVIYNIVRDAAMRLNEHSSIKAVSISTRESRLTISPLKEDLFLVLAMDRSRHIGKAIAESRKAIEKIEKELG